MIAGDGSWNLDISKLWISEEDYEDVLHVLRDCSAARIIWDKLIPKERLSRFYNGSLHNWMTNNLQNHLSITLDGVDWPLSKVVVHKSQSCLPTSYTTSNWVRLRIDSSIRFDEGFAAAGDFVGDQNDGWIVGFCRYLSNCIVLEVELWGILDGLNFILDRSFVRVLIQTGSIETVNTIQEGSSGNSNSALVRRIHHILAQMKQWKIHHISRKESFITDSLAKFIHSKRLSLRLVINPPMRI
ncbi:hypothetical protein Goari_016300 [Gossypium aridum]|uniref:RNase H type-1 domain-containing protein n=1 Tax=Gossypium aridum TaxID=34290 RepID=A0A7J8WJD1_GOSAI|nr:hypothetical protein [Gossypium aridum]